MPLPTRADRCPPLRGNERTDVRPGWYFYPREINFALKRCQNRLSSRTPEGGCGDLAVGTGMQWDRHGPAGLARTYFLKIDFRVLAFVGVDSTGDLVYTIPRQPNIPVKPFRMHPLLGGRGLSGEHIELCAEGARREPNLSGKGTETQTMLERFAAFWQSSTGLPF